MSKRTIWALALAFAALVGLLLYLLARGPAAPAGSGEASLEAEAGVPEEGRTRSVDLFFPGRGARLYPEAREVVDGGSVEERIAVVVAAVIEGPRSDSLRAPLPSGVIAGRVYALGGGVFAIDLQSEGQQGLGGTGSQRELLTLYSLVNSVLLNFEEAERLILVWNGRQPSTLAGHIDTSRPLGADLALLAPP